MNINLYTCTPLTRLNLVGERKYDNDAAFTKFRRQLFHRSLSFILQSLKNGADTAQVMRCPDGQLRRGVYCLGPYIADYPEQVLLTGIVQGWCPKCVSPPQPRNDLS